MYGQMERLQWASVPIARPRWQALAPVTGNIGHALYNYMRNAGSYVLPSKHFGTFVLGCHYEFESGIYRVRPWDGVGRLVSLRQIGFSVTLSFGRIEEVQISSRKNLVSVTIENPADKAMDITVFVVGLWGTKVSVDTKTYVASNGHITIPIKIPKRTTNTIYIKVIE